MSEPMSPLATDPYLTPVPARRPQHRSRPRGERQRQLLLGLIASSPGVHVLRAASVLGLNWNTCHHHVRRLEAEGRIVVRKVAGLVCLFDRREGAVTPRLAPVALREARNNDIARMTMENPGKNQKEMAQSLGLAASVVHRRLLRMEELGLVHRVAHGREVSVFATDVLKAALAAAPAAPMESAGGSAPSGIFGETPFWGSADEVATSAS
ncbi:MAG: winged helix-turn-helix transcriptional regulator [Thermoplasmatota archaeon]